jgi:putative ABC transport system permease protein
LSARLALAGALAGIIATYALTRYLASLLFGVGPTDVPTIAGAALMTVGLALAASYAPARRAASIDPTITLRPE